jgi:hypothetical protein
LHSASRREDLGCLASPAARDVVERVSYPEFSGEGLVCLYGGGKLVDSTVTGSTTVDIATFRRPKLVNSTCGTSRHDPSGVPWGVCTND